MNDVKFSSPPLKEVVLGVVFNAPALSSVDYGLYWREIRERFPVKPVDKPALGGEPIVSLIPPLRRVWFESDNKKELLQLQSDRFYYNWRKQDSAESYPRFIQIYPKFQKEWQNFSQWCEKNIGFLIPVQYELTYINHIDKDFGWESPADHQSILTFAGKDWVTPLGSPESYVFALQFSLPDKAGTLTINGNQGYKTGDQDSSTQDPLMVLELTARSSGTADDFDGWFKLAHDYIVSSFIDLTQKSIQQKWGLYE
jgi:uncharacterized protein (TIGR04255 family)